MLMPLSYLSYISVLGVLSTFLVVAVMFFDGFSTFESPGSLWNPAETSFSFRSFTDLGVSFGLFMAGVSHHHHVSILFRANILTIGCVVRGTCCNPIVDQGHGRSDTVRHNDRLCVPYFYRFLCRYGCGGISDVRQFCQR